MCTKFQVWVVFRLARGCDTNTHTVKIWLSPTDCSSHVDFDIPLFNYIMLNLPCQLIFCLFLDNSNGCRMRCRHSISFHWCQHTPILWISTLKTEEYIFRKPLVHWCLRPKTNNFYFHQTTLSYTKIPTRVSEPKPLQQLTITLQHIQILLYHPKHH